MLSCCDLQSGYVVGQGCLQGQPPMEPRALPLGFPGGQHSHHCPSSSLEEVSWLPGTGLLGACTWFPRALPGYLFPSLILLCFLLL